MALSDSTSESISAQESNRSNKTTSLALLVASAFFMEFLDGTVIATALPDMAKSFGVAAIDLNIGISAYLLTLAVLIPANGWIAERFGARFIFTLALSIFTISSLFCGLANSVTSFVLMRVLQGVGGAMMVPVGRLVVLQTTPKNQLIKAIALLTWPGLVAPIIGPPLGGFITTYASWHWIFFLNIPLGIIAICLSLKLMPNLAITEKRAFDWGGFALTGIAMLCLVTGLELFSQQDFSWMNGLLVLGMGCGALLWSLQHLKRAKTPLINLNALSIPSFKIMMRGGFMLRTTISSAPFMLPLMFQVGFGMNAFQAGSLVLAVFAGNLAMKPATTRLIHYFGFRKLLIGNGVVCVFSLLFCAFLSPDTPQFWTLLLLFIGGLSRSMQFTGVNSLAFSDVPTPLMNSANTLFSTSIQLANGLGITLGALSIRLGSFLTEEFGYTSMQGAGFRFGFVMIAILTAIGVYDMMRLATNAGDSVLSKKGH